MNKRKNDELTLAERLMKPVLFFLGVMVGLYLFVACLAATVAILLLLLVDKS